MALSKEQILKSGDLPRERVDVPEWGDEGTPIDQRYVFVRMMTAKEHDEYDAAIYRVIDQGGRELNRQDYRARLAAMTVVDDDGKNIFTTADIAALAAKSCAPLDRIVYAAKRLSGLLPAKESTEEQAAKN